MNYPYYTTKEQLSAAIHIARALSQSLVEENTFELKNLIMKWISFQIPPLAYDEDKPEEK